MLAKEQGITMNCVEAAEWYRKAADGGHATAQFPIQD